MCSGDVGVLGECWYIVNVPLPRVFTVPSSECSTALHCEVVTSPLSPASWTLGTGPAAECTAVSRGAGSSAVDCLQQWNHHQTLPCRPVTAGVMCAGDCCMMALARPAGFLVTEATPSLLTELRSL